MEFVRTLLEQQPMVALFLTIAIGYLVGEINIKGFSLGVGAVLFVALAIGWFAPKSVPAADGRNARSRALPLCRRHPVRQGVLPRPGERRGPKANFLALIGVLLAGVVSLAFVKARAESRLRPRTVRRIGDQHADAAGGHPDARQRRPRGRLLGRLSVWRRGPDPVSLCRLS